MKKTKMLAIGMILYLLSNGLFDCLSVTWSSWGCVQSCVEFLSIHGEDGTLKYHSIYIYQ